MITRNLYIWRMLAIGIILASIAVVSGSCQILTTNNTEPPPPFMSITGHIYDDANNSPLSGVTVTVIRSPNNKVKESITDEHGRYLITDIPVGEYLVNAKAEGYRIETYDGADGLYRTPPEKVTKVSVSEDKATTGIDFRMKALASISGHVYRADNGQPIENARIAVSGPHWSTGPRSASTKADGSFEVSGLNNGNSAVMCEATGYVTQYYSGTYEPKKSVNVTTFFGENTRNIDFYMEVGGSISGTIFEPDRVTPTIQVTKPGSDFKETMVHFYQISGLKVPVIGESPPTPPTSSVKANSDGSYRIDGLLTGEYDLIILTRLSTGVLTSAHKRVNVTTGQETEGIDFITLPGGSLSGHVYFEEGVTLAERFVIDASIDTGFPIGSYYFSAGSSLISSDGNYSFDSLPQGKIYLSPSGDRRYAGRRYTTNVVSGQNTIFDIVLE